MNKPKIQVIIGSIREGRKAEPVAKWFMEAVKGVDAAELELVDLQDYPLPFFADAVSPSVREGKHANPAVQKWIDKVAEADGYIMITPEYNHSTSAILKNAIDYPYREWNGKAVAFVGYGGIAAGSRAVEHLRQMAAELQMYDIRETVLIPVIWSAFDANGNLANAEMHAKNAVTVVERVAKAAMLLKAGRVSI